MHAILTKYWSVLLSLLSGAFFAGSWVQSRSTVTAMAVQAEHLDGVTKALDQIIVIEGNHTVDIVTVRDQVKTLEARFNDSKTKGSK